MRCVNSYKGCGWQGSVGTLDKHMETCEFECVPCKYQYVGCDVKMMRKDIAQHEEEDDKKHLHLALKSVAIPTLSDGEALVFKMTEYSSKKKYKEVFFSDPFYTHSNGYKMYLEIRPSGTGTGEGTHLSIFSHLLKGPFDETLPWPFLGTVSVGVLNQVNDYNHYRIDREYTDNECARPGGGGWGTSQFISHSALSNESGNTQFVKNDSLYFRVSVKVNSHQPWLECGIKMNSVFSSLRKSVTKPQVFKLEGYTSKKSNNEAVSTEAFFASPGSYKLYIVMYPNGNGDGVGTHVSIFAYLLEGQYDQNLSWPVLGNVTFELLNQRSDESHYAINLAIKEEDDLRVGKSIGFPSFIRHDEIQTNNKKQFLKDDALYFRVTPEFGECKPWLSSK